jgi:hypothetical protein
MEKVQRRPEGPKEVTVELTADKLPFSVDVGHAHVVETVEPKVAPILRIVAPMPAEGTILKAARNIGRVAQIRALSSLRSREAGRF